MVAGSLIVLVQIPSSQSGGAGGIRTPDLIIANDALSQLSYSPEMRVFNGITWGPFVPVSG